MGIQSTTFTAPRCRILLDGRRIGRGTNVTINVEYEHQDVEVLDNFELEELAPIAYRVSGSIARVAIVGSTVKSIGMFPNAGKNSDEHLLNVLLKEDMVLALYDKGMSRNIYTVMGVKFMGHGFSLAARGIGGVNVNWRAVREQDESESAS